MPMVKMKSICKTFDIEPDSVDWKATWPTKNTDYRNAELSIGTWVVFADGKVDPLPIMFVVMPYVRLRHTLILGHTL